MTAIDADTPAGVVPCKIISASLFTAVVVTIPVYVKVDFVGAPIKDIIVFDGCPTIIVPNEFWKENVILDVFDAGVNVAVTVHVIINVPNGKIVGDVPVVKIFVNVDAEILTIPEFLFELEYPN